jgi:drug/metabolite transporter (DMT)-like permease
MLVNVGPVLIAVLAGILLREGFPRALVVGCAVALAGAVVIGLATAERGMQAGWGAVLCIVAAATYAGGVVAQKPLLERTSGLQITFLACVIGAVACLPFAPGLVEEAGDAGGGALAWAVYLGAVPTAIGFTTWAYALKRTTAGRMGATTYLVPPLAILMGWALLGETPPVLAVAGGALCLAGVAITRGAVPGAARRSGQRARAGGAPAVAGPALREHRRAGAEPAAAGRPLPADGSAP